MRPWLLGPLVLLGCGRLDFAAGPDAGDVAGATFRSLCGFAQVTVVQNGLPIDEAAGTTLASAVADGCGVTPAVRVVSQDTPGILDPATDRPLIAADDLVVIGGGDGPNRAIAYLLQSDTPVIWSGSSFATYKERRSGRTIVQGAVSDGHDFALVMVVAEPIGGDLVLSASGMTASGTTAAAYWFATQIAPAITADAHGWELVEWTDADADPAPSAGDTFTVIETGS